MAEQKKDFDKELLYKDPAEVADEELEDVVGGVFVAAVHDNIAATPLPSRGDLKATADFLTPAGGAKQPGGLFRLIFRKGSRGGSNKNSDNGSMWI